MKRKVWSGVGALALAAAAWPQLAGASGDYGCTADWTLALSTYDCAGSALISPRNDTRINLAWLLRERSGISSPGTLAYPAPDWENVGFGRVFLSWDVMQSAFWPQPADGAEDGGEERQYGGTRCQTLESGGAAFTDALAGAKGLGAGERVQLEAARSLLKPACDGDRGAAQWPAGITSASGRAWLGYLQGGRAFYADDFATARTRFAALTKEREPWLAETGRYMVARNELAAAQEGAIDEWGGFAGVDKVDAGAARRAQAALADYLAAYPRGRYAASATGLQRRALWLQGNGAALAKTYQGILTTGSPLDPSLPAGIEELEAKALFGTGIGDSADAPLILATWDLLRMRQTAPDMAPYVPKPLTAGELAAQERVFAKVPGLFTYLQASHAYHVQRDDRRVLVLIPDGARAKSFTPLAFSGQVLRGLALERLKDRNAAGFWKQLAGGARDLYQRPAVELAWAMNRERAGAVAEVFAPDSPVTEQDIRVRLLQHVAGPDLLRAQSGAKAASRWERQAALFTLLGKQLARGRYASFGRDLAMIPANAPTDGWIGDWYDDAKHDVPLGLFTRGKWQDGYACPALARTAAILAERPTDARSRLCLGEFYRLNGFDYWLDNALRPPATQLAGTPEQFPGTPTMRAGLYAGVMADKSAAPEETAYALYRAVQCYAPSGNNECGGDEVSKDVRRSWFQRLKRDFPRSKWATQLKYYW